MRYMVILNENIIDKRGLFGEYERLIYDENGNLIAGLRRGETNFECINTLNESKFDKYASENLKANESNIYDKIKEELKSGKSTNNIVKNVINKVNNDDTLGMYNVIEYLEDDEDDSFDKYQPIKQLKDSIKSFIKKSIRSKENKKHKNDITGKHYLVISNNKEDLLGASRERGWTSCIGPDGEFWDYHKQSYPNSFIAYIINRIKKDGNKCQLYIRNYGDLDYVVARKVIRQTENGWCVREQNYYGTINDPSKFDNIILDFINNNDDCKSDPIGVGYFDTNGIQEYINVSPQDIDKCVSQINDIISPDIAIKLLIKQKNNNMKLNEKLKKSFLSYGSPVQLCNYIKYIEPDNENLKQKLLKSQDPEGLDCYVSNLNTSQEDRQKIKNILLQKNTDESLYYYMKNYKIYNIGDNLSDDIVEKFLQTNPIPVFLYKYLENINKNDEKIKQKLLDSDDITYINKYFIAVLKKPIDTKIQKDIKESLIQNKNILQMLNYLILLDPNDRTIIEILLKSPELPTKISHDESINIAPKLKESIKSEVLNSDDIIQVYNYLYMIDHEDSNMRNKLIELDNDGQFVVKYLVTIGFIDNNMLNALKTYSVKHITFVLSTRGDFLSPKIAKSLKQILINSKNTEEMMTYLISQGSDDSVLDAFIDNANLNELLTLKNIEELVLEFHIKRSEKAPNAEKILIKVLKALPEKFRKLSSEHLHKSLLWWERLNCDRENNDDHIFDFFKKLQKDDDARRKWAELHNDNITCIYLYLSEFDNNDKIMRRAFRKSLTIVNPKEASLYKFLLEPIDTPTTVVRESIIYKIAKIIESKFKFNESEYHLWIR